MKFRLRVLVAFSLLLLLIPSASTSRERVMVSSSLASRPVLSSFAVESWIAVTKREQDLTFLAAWTPPQEGTTGAQRPQEHAYYSGDPGVWDRIAACESGGDWAANTGNSYFGGLQENMGFWNTYATRVTVTHDDGTQTEELVAPRPDLASREEQINAAERARDSGRGYTPWPVCGRRA